MQLSEWHVYIEVIPPHRSAERLKVRASVETAPGRFITDTLPEESAAQLRAVEAVAVGRWRSVDEAVRNRWKTKGRLGTTSVFPVHEREFLGDNAVYS